ncbi:MULTISPECIES: hypothetical protein [unclassified Rubrivivax]|uniref:hypothetical protein n=1 Tax=unclassified Rubrivivax TaxID=2649762 RepID=UPI001E384217|nr:MULTISPECIES: hypothetical protein [unclassified Rubrivivax]MCC9598435.1 hypothetical protein [Rubrivivax sp. JA1055]MCC9648135.1 hypothetical protein [Rubrivivax sp. JA1029]
MNRLRKVIAAVALAAFPLICAAEGVQLGSLQLDLPEGFSVRSAKQPFELAGPTGEKVLVTVMRSKADTSGEPNPDEQAKTVSFGSGFLRKQAERAGKLVLPSANETLTDGSILAYIGSETSGLFSSGYFLQYMLVSPSGRLAFITVEGKGNIDDYHARYLAVLGNATWLP